MNTHPTPKVFATLLALTLLALFIAACGRSANRFQTISEKITICHASGDSTTPYTELLLTVAELPDHSKHPNDIIPAPASGCPNELVVNGNDGKITICHATGSQTNPYNKITIAFSGLSGHSKHKNDIILAPETADCPVVTPTPTETSTPTETPTALGTPTETVTPQATGSIGGKVTICHATGSKKNPYVMINVSVNGLNGHGKHSRDIIPAPAGGCPK